MDKIAPIKVVLVDDQQFVHEAVSALLRTCADIRLVGQAYNGQDALRLCEMTKPNLVLMDVVMPGMNAAETTETLLQKMPRLKVLVLSSYQEYEFIKTMLDSGAVGYIVKHSITEDLTATIRDCINGQTVLSPEIAEKVLHATQETNGHQAHQHDYNLTDREKQVLKLLGGGMSNDEIATELSITQPTVRFHLKNMIHKFGVDTRSEMMVLAKKVI